MEKIIKARRRNGFTMVSNIARTDTGISLKAFGLLTYIMGLPDDWQINVRQLVQVKTDGRDAVYSAINELIDAGYCQRRRVYDSNNRFAGMEYVFSDEKIFDEPQPEIPQPEKPDPEKPDPEKPDPEKPYNNNTYSINTFNKNTLVTNTDSAFLQKADFSPAEAEVLEVEASPLARPISQDNNEQQPTQQRAAAAKKNKPKVAAKSAEKKGDPAHQICVDAFDDRYRKHSGTKFIWQAKELAAIKKIIPIIRSLWAEKKGCQPSDISPESVAKALQVFCDRVEADNWLVKNYSPTGILSNINKIVSTHGNQNTSTGGGAKRNNFGGFASKQLLDEVLAITGATSASFNLEDELERLRKEYSAG